MRQFSTILARLAAKLVIGLIRVYQLTLSYFIGQQCRFTPSCSVYAAEAICIHGLARGGALSVRRICRCGPNSAGGFDPIPPRLD